MALQRDEAFCLDGSRLSIMKRTANDPTAFGVQGTITYRLARPEDDRVLAKLDGSFTTDSVFEVVETGDGFTLRQIPVTPPIHEVFPADEDTKDDRDPELSQTVVACNRDELCGFVESSFEPWNRRLTICDIQVAPVWREKGLGRTLMSHAFGFAEERGAGHVWLEVSNINAPAISAYLRMGFAFCGLDTRLYDATESAGEQAIFMARQIH
ncbi:GNAT family N-acetyltransferase [Actinomadura citrea]|uniref:Ribosomal protein S18 acetylase RimI-like enzyme n=1 Tax=Actinomadura citrea TaxID=46158 RepID=A0A7Y9GBA9_9ACTN|nr:GNAT family N-acetyltransferase [Actinomadura citrea]NYE13241.1 ribosomal protein S18 acetylase RimI-like enzyme [Actinomadura citrea]